MIPLPSLRLAIAGGALLSVFICGWIVGGWRGDAALERLRADHAQAVAQSLQAQRTREAQIAATVERIASDTQALQAAIAADANRAARTAGGLRDAAHAVAAQCGSGAAVARGGEANRLADVLAESVDRYREVAAAADRAIVAGQACEAAYGAVRLTP